VGILAQLAFLILAAMLLINVVMVKFSERDLIHARISTVQLAVHAIAPVLTHLLNDGEKKGNREASQGPFKQVVSRILLRGGISDALIINAKGKPIFSTDSSSRTKNACFIRAVRAMETRDWSTSFSGKTWGVLWFSHQRLWISAPLISGDRTVGSIALSNSLIPIYETIRESEKFILLYILLDTLILTVVGIYLLSRIVVRPIHDLLKLTSQYKEGDFLPATGDSPRNEIGQLSRSLNLMLRRLSENKKELQEHITSLEKANRELQQAQNEIIRSEKLASVGRLSAGIAHEIGNPIGIVQGYLEIIKRGDLNETEAKDFMNRIETEVSRINNIIRDLLDFSRHSIGKPAETHVHDIITHTLHILTPQPMMGDIRINTAFDAHDDTVFVDSNELQQVFINIIMNAADAHAGHEEMESDSMEKTLLIQSAVVNHSLELRFIDNGPGIANEDRARIFDPFYTTKEPGAGTGLGLSVCYRIIEGMKGSLRAESTVGRGTVIILELPLYTSAPPA